MANNADGLNWKYGIEEGDPALVTEYRSNGPKRYVEVLLDAAFTPAVADNSVIIDQSYAIPKGAMIEHVEIQTTTDFTGSGTLNVGITDQDGGTTIQDVDALVVAATIAEINTGGKDIAGWVGTRVNSAGTGTALEESVYLTWEVDTAALVAGKATIRVFYAIPKVETDTLVWNKTA